MIPMTQHLLNLTLWVLREELRLRGTTKMCRPRRDRVSAWGVGAALPRPIDRDCGSVAATTHVLNAAETQHACVLATRQVCAPLVCNGRL